MIFIINGRVKFNEYEGTLEDADDPQHIQPLVAATCRLLSIFVRNNEMLIKRQQLLDEVWEERGLKGTNSNLNNYISLLRRHLAQFGENELIITYPRQGFKFVARKITRHVAANIDNKPEVEEESALSEQPAYPAPKRGRGSGGKLSHWLQRSSWRKRFTLISVLCTGILIMTSHHFSGGSDMLNQARLDDCQIYGIGLDLPGKEMLTNTVKPYVNCQRKTKVYYYSNIIQDSNQSPEKMLVSCRETSERQPCKVIYIP
ncbi:winged helix-turn-helix domain-containing protein [Serratia marcescens]